jgi:hypothetical protein
VLDIRECLIGLRVIWIWIWIGIWIWHLDLDLNLNWHLDLDLDCGDVRWRRIGREGPSGRGGARLSPAELSVDVDIGGLSEKCSGIVGVRGGRGLTGQ